MLNAPLVPFLALGLSVPAADPLHNGAPATAPVTAPATGPAAVPADDTHQAPAMDSRARPVDDADTRSLFRPPIVYPDTIHTESQIATYGDKNPVTTQHPLRLGGRPLYREGDLGPGLNLIGDQNLFFPHFLVFGDWRTATGYSDDGGDKFGHLGVFNTRLNLDIDIGLTATERLHFFMRPLDQGTEFTGFTLSGPENGAPGQSEGDEALIFDPSLETYFFEGDLGAIFGGPGARSLPIALGKIPLLFQNGVWVEDAFIGAAVSIPAKNSRRFDISNYDWTFFAGFDDVTTGASNGIQDDDPRRKEDDILLVGATTFIEAHEGYYEFGAGYTAGSDAVSDIDYLNLTGAFSKRYFGKISNSVRAIVNLGQDQDGENQAEGVLLLAENSLITTRPSTLIPYLNLFLGLGTPQSLARDAAAGGVLKNTGINFETDAQTGFPALNATAEDAVGGAVGVEYLFNLDKQVVFEFAVQGDHGDSDDAGGPLGTEYAFGTRLQLPLNHALILRFDAMAGFRDDGEDIGGVRLEFRWKF
jgi:hypothetical protein